MHSALDFGFPATFPVKSSFVGGHGIPSPGFGSRVRFCSLPPCSSIKAESCLKRDLHKQRSSLESMFCYDKPIPEEIIEEPVGLSMSEREIGDNQRCTCCEAKGALLCATCSGTGLYVDSIMESQGIIVKVRCLGCGGTGNIMCKICGGRGHVGH
ncbi:Heat shock protein DnaJ cysteine-rich domain superfamily [Arabidopsis suecica]|uniref:Heat shock protein DnaJ cysteine-rich domain superfamily n=1 Tax=Arabidopsis suecica TaxID=45249 RepID=A0A8T1ZBD9_ARASU|nr:Heat shock protein DnaJ cysteine-rich domain superfamily [Arabidopsis suecica]